MVAAEAEFLNRAPRTRAMAHKPKSTTRTAYALETVGLALAVGYPARAR
jgi:hypothetical protein